MTALAPTLQRFFTDRLTRQRNASSHTIAAYRDTFRLLLVYASERTGTEPTDLDIADLDAELIGGFLDHLETDRHNTVRTRNARLAAIHSLFRWAALAHPEHAESIARVLAIPAKRHERAIVTYLAEPEIVALLAGCDPATWTGRRDRAMFVLAAQTGLRVSEITALTRSDVHLGVGAHVICHGKGRKQRATPLTTSTVSVFNAWLRERTGTASDPHRKIPEPRRRRAPPRRPRRNRHCQLPVAKNEACHRPHPAPQRRHAATPRRRRHRRHRSLARP